jgi:hypothetical protein
MLYTSTVESATLGLLKSLMAEPHLSSFNLVGGTALSLQIGHRKSIDLDFFGFPDELDIPLISNLLQEYGSLEQLTAAKNIFSVRVNEIKVDFVRYRYAWLKPIHTKDGIRLATLEDIAAMKLSAITGRGRKKDFADLYFLLKHFSLREMVDFYEKKYPDGNMFLLAKSLNYFEDAEEDEDLVLFKKGDWPTMKQTIEKEVKKLFQ